MSTVTAIGLGIAKSVFQVHGIEVEGAVIIRRQAGAGGATGADQAPDPGDGPARHRLPPGQRGQPPGRDSRRGPAARLRPGGPCSPPDGFLIRTQCGRLDRTGAEAELQRWQGAAGRGDQAGQPLPALAAHRGRAGSDPLCPAAWNEAPLARATAGAASHQSSGGRLGQQEGPDSMGDYGQGRALSRARNRARSVIIVGKAGDQEVGGGQTLMQDPVEPGSGTRHACQSIVECELLVGIPSQRAL